HPAGLLPRWQRGHQNGAPLQPQIGLAACEPRYFRLYSGRGKKDFMRQEQRFAISFDDAVLPGDIAHIRKMIENAAVFSREEVPTAAALAEIRMGGNDADSHFLFARDQDHNLLGYTCYGPVPLTQQRFMLYWIVVNPKQQQQGLGKNLIVETELRIRKAGGIHVY